TNMYGPKYQGSHWANLLLTEYGVDATDARVRRGARRILEDLSARPNAMEWVLGRDHGMSCFTGSVVRYLALAGYGTDPRVEPLVQRLVRDAKKVDAACVTDGGKPWSGGYARSTPRGSSTTRAPSRRSHGCSRGRIRAGAGRAAHRTPPACPRKSTRASGSRCRCAPC